jgi:hypothetical protein
VTDVTLHGDFADEEVLRDLGIGLAASDELEHL